MPMVVRPIASGTGDAVARRCRWRPASGAGRRAGGARHRPASGVKSRGRAGMAASGMAAATATRSARRSARHRTGRLAQPAGGHARSAASASARGRGPRARPSTGFVAFVHRRGSAGVDGSVMSLA